MSTPRAAPPSPPASCSSSWQPETEIAAPSPAACSILPKRRRWKTYSHQASTRPRGWPPPYRVEAPPKSSTSSSMARGFPLWWQDNTSRPLKRSRAANNPNNSELWLPERTRVTPRRTATIRDRCVESPDQRNSLRSNGLPAPRRLRRMKWGFSLSRCLLTEGASNHHPRYAFVPRNAPIRVECPANSVRPIALSRSLKQSRPRTTENDRGRTNLGTRPWSTSP
jgi:hypothetical protein